MSYATIDESRLNVARHAARLFWQDGVEKTSGDAIAAAAGLSKRTVWRYFRSKEASVEPLFLVTGLRFVDWLRGWPRHMSLESFLDHLLSSLTPTEQEMSDGLAAARLVSLLRTEPAIRSAYLMAGAQAEDGFAEIIADRVRRAVDDFEVRLCAATTTAAMRAVDEEVCIATFARGQAADPQEIGTRLAAAIRAASTLPFCDPVPG